MTTRASATFRTRIYVDGYNFYYGCLKRTPHKWLDLFKLFDSHVLPSILYEPAGLRGKFLLETPAIKFFTAPILKNFAKSPESVSSQIQYHNALAAHLGQNIDLVLGYYDAREARAHLVVKGTPATKCDKVDVWKLVEKQTDVNLALHAYGDAVRGAIDCAVIVTNDTDLVPALTKIRSDTRVIVGLVVPSMDKARPVNSDLAAQAHWVRTHLTEPELIASQLPRFVPGERQAWHKPISWYRHPDLVASAVKSASRVRGGRGAAMKWLGTPNKYLEGSIPIEMLDSPEGAEALLRYMSDWDAQRNG